MFLLYNQKKHLKEEKKLLPLIFKTSGSPERAWPRGHTIMPYFSPFSGFIRRSPRFRILDPSLAERETTRAPRERHLASVCELWPSVGFPSSDSTIPIAVTCSLKSNSFFQAKIFRRLVLVTWIFVGLNNSWNKYFDNKTQQLSLLYGNFNCNACGRAFFFLFVVSSCSQGLFYIYNFYIINILYNIIFIVYN